MKTYLSALTLFVLMLFCNASSSSIAAPAYSDSMVRAAVVMGILRFAGWPENNEPENELRLCSVGTSGTIKALNELEEMPKIGKLRVNYSGQHVGPSHVCHAVILGNGLPDNFIDEATLYICDDCTPKAREQSAIVLEQGNQRIQFHVNLDRAREQGITLSSSLIELAASCRSRDPKIRGCHE